MLTYVIILIVVILLGVPTVIFVNKYPRTRLIFQALFLALIIVFGYLLYRNIKKPIDFDKELKKREDTTVERLKDIRSIQIIYKDKYGNYTGDFDTLINFVKYDSLPIKKIIEVKKWDKDELSQAEALKRGILKQEETYVPTYDSLWHNKGYPIDDIKYAPYTNHVEFTMGAGEVETASKVKVKVFECYVKYEDLLQGMDEQLVVNYIDEKTTNERFGGLKVGSLEEATNNAGNWEQ